MKNLSSEITQPYNNKKWESKVMKYLWLTASTVALTLSLWLVKPAFAQKDEVGQSGQSTTEQLSILNKLNEYWKIIEEVKFSPKQESLLKMILINNHIGKLNGRIPDYCDISIKKVSVKSKKDIWNIIHWAENLPELSETKKMNKDNYSQIIAELFDTSDTDIWTKNKDWTSLSQEQKRIYQFLVELQAKKSSGIY